MNVEVAHKLEIKQEKIDAKPTDEEVNNLQNTIITLRCILNLTMNLLSLTLKKV
jgi:hypothetical protein